MTDYSASCANKMTKNSIACSFTLKSGGCLSHSLADLCCYVYPDSSCKTCKYKHSSHREYLKKHKKKRLRGLSLLTDQEYIMYISLTHTRIYIYPRMITIRWLYFNTPSELTGSTFIPSICRYRG
ncbi:hypothetical protein Tsp_09937 [Trichinella spiralis]|uniref:hypothetical protein n=1 Tax=Trichinella spiralis TaxID=6334 RepID=UPI0001EFE00B|nr:hypothetical protein Tsp_09937 [Trichinella spiralis]